MGAAQSARLAEIYEERGVAAARLTTLPFTLAHIEHLRPEPPSSAPPASSCSCPAWWPGVVPWWISQWEFRLSFLGVELECVRCDSRS